MIVAESIFYFAALLLLIPVIVFMIEVMCALFETNAERSIKARRPAGISVAVLIPAHDEGEGIGSTVSDILKHLTSFDRLLVVADNCSDATAQNSRAAGAETIERCDLETRGKGFALDFGIQYLGKNPPDIVVIVDADCRLGHESIDALVACSHARQSSVQASYEMSLPSNADAKRRVAGFAWIVKNHVRPKGLAVLGLPCQLMGTGMAFPWGAISHIDLATDNIVEDVKIGLDLAAIGFPPIYCPAAVVESSFPLTERGFKVQRQRWEAGSLGTILKIAPTMFLRGLLSLNVPLMAMVADLIVPPLMMLLSILILGVILSLILIFVGGSVFPEVMFAGSLSIFLLAVVLAWARFGRHVLLPRDVLTLPGVFVQKFGHYLAMWNSRGAGWIRTDRD